MASACFSIVFLSLFCVRVFWKLAYVGTHVSLPFCACGFCLSLLSLSVCMCVCVFSVTMLVWWCLVAVIMYSTLSSCATVCSVRASSYYFGRVNVCLSVFSLTDGVRLCVFPYCACVRARVFSLAVLVWWV